jgi:GGDEF domain-containing protein
MKKGLMDKELRILMLEDSPADAELEEHELRKAGNDKLEKHADEYNARSTKPYKLSLSKGFAFADPEKPFSFDSMLSEADQNMYLQKQKKESEG